MSLLKIVKFLQGMVEVVWHELRICCTMFDVTDENTKELKSDLAGTGQKVDTHAITIKQLELQLAQLSATMNTHQSGTLPTNTVKNSLCSSHYSQW